jgi:GAF domain-containing protein
MTDEGVLLAAVALAVADSEREQGGLLRSIVCTAQAIFAASASSILILDRDTDELVLEAVARENEQSLVGHRFPASAGIAGWVAAAGEPLVVDDLTTSTLFARDVAEATGYVPSALMAAPITHEEEVLGVLEVMDYATPGGTPLQAAELLSLFAAQAAAALVVVRRAESARQLLECPGSEYADVMPVLETLLRLGHRERAAGRSLLRSVGDLLGTAAEP